MRRLLALALLALAATGALAAQAATPTALTGVVVAKDAGRKALVVAVPGGGVRTVRTSAPIARVPVGARVRTRAARLGDGTLRGSVTVTGRATRGVVRGVVVRVDRRNARLLLSAGGSVFAVGRKALRTTRATRTTQGASSLAAGDLVAVTLSLQGGGAQATAVQTVGQASTLELEGIVTGSAPGKLTLAVVHKGLVDVVVPAGVQVPAFAPGDEAILEVSVDANGVFTLVSAGQDEEDDGAITPSVDVVGTLTSLAPPTVQPATGSPVSCALPAGEVLPAELAGLTVEMICVPGPSGPELAELVVDDGTTASGDDDEDDDGDDDHGHDDRGHHGDDGDDD